MNLNSMFRKYILENVEIDINFIGIELADLELYSFLRYSMWMPFIGKNWKTVINEKLLNQFSLHWCQFSCNFNDKTFIQK